MTKATEADARMQRPLGDVDPAIAGLLREEAQRQATGLELIPSENLGSEAVLEAMGSVFTNKYAEGDPGRRYYGGGEVCLRRGRRVIWTRRGVCGWRSVAGRRTIHRAASR